jgi:hypothetical protein
MMAASSRAVDCGRIMIYGKTHCGVVDLKYLKKLLDES